MYLYNNNTNNLFADLPGVPKEDLDVTITRGQIIIKGERKRKWEEGDAIGNHLIERSWGKVSRTLPLPVDCDHEKAVATFEMGVLKVDFPKLTGGGYGGKKLLIA